jgi:protein TonB
MTALRLLGAGNRATPIMLRQDPIWRPLLLSAGMHTLLIVGIIAGALLGWRMQVRKPADPVSVEVVIGGGAQVTGAQPQADLPPVETPAPVPAPPVPALPNADAAPPPSAPPPSAPTAEAPRVPRSEPPPPSDTAGLIPMPPAAPAPPVQLPPRPTLPPSVAEPSPPEPPPVQTASLRRPPSPESAETPEVRLGDGAAGPLAEILDKNGLIRRAEADNANMPPVYPLDAARRGEQGTVTLRLTIGTDGGVLTAEVAKSSGSPRLDRAALTRIETWHFKPAMRDGKPQIDVIEFGVEFQLN